MFVVIFPISFFLIINQRTKEEKNNSLKLFIYLRLFNRMAAQFRRILDIVIYAWEQCYLFSSKRDFPIVVSRARLQFEELLWNSMVWKFARAWCIWYMSKNVCTETDSCFIYTREKARWEKWNPMNWFIGWDFQENLSNYSLCVKATQHKVSKTWFLLLCVHVAWFYYMKKILTEIACWASPMKSILIEPLEESLYAVIFCHFSFQESAVHITHGF